jgi:muramidase (phage lysozyme)
VIVGGQLFSGYRDHPRVLVDLPKLKIQSTAAGRYQLLRRYYDAYRKSLGLKDSPFVTIFIVDVAEFSLGFG